MDLPSRTRDHTRQRAQLTATLRLTTPKQPPTRARGCLAGTYPRLRGRKLSRRRRIGLSELYLARLTPRPEAPAAIASARNDAAFETYWRKAPASLRTPVTRIGDRPASRPTPVGDIAIVARGRRQASMPSRSAGDAERLCVRTSARQRALASAVLGDADVHAGGDRPRGSDRLRAWTPRDAQSTTSTSQCAWWETVSLTLWPNSRPSVL